MKTLLTGFLLIILPLSAVAGQGLTPSQSTPESASVAPQVANKLSSLFATIRKTKRIRPKRPGRVSLILSLVGVAMISAGATQVLSWTAIGLIPMLLPLGLLVMFLAIVFGGIALYRHRNSNSRDWKTGIAGLILGSLPYVVLVSWGLSLLVRSE